MKSIFRLCDFLFSISKAFFQSQIVIHLHYVLNKGKLCKKLQ